MTCSKQKKLIRQNTSCGIQPASMYVLMFNMNYINTSNTAARLFDNPLQSTPPQKRILKPFSFFSEDMRIPVRHTGSLPQGSQCVCFPLVFDGKERDVQWKWTCFKRVVLHLGDICLVHGLAPFLRAPLPVLPKQPGLTLHKEPASTKTHTHMHIHRHTYTHAHIHTHRDASHLDLCAVFNFTSNPGQEAPV